MDMCIYDDYEVNFDWQQGGLWDKVFNPREQQRWTQEANGNCDYSLTFRHNLNLLQKDTFRKTRVWHNNSVLFDITSVDFYIVSSKPD